MENDDHLFDFEARGVALPAGGETGVVHNDGARIWYASFGSGAPVLLLHGGLGHAGNFGKQVPALVEAGRRVIVIDSRGHGRSTRDERPYSYQVMASDVRAVMDVLDIDRAPMVGWSDGACTALVLAHDTPSRSGGVFFFACNMDNAGTKPFVFTPMLGNCIDRHKKDYAALSGTPEDFQSFSDAVGLMQRSQPDYSAAQLAEIGVPVTIVQSEHNEFIKPEHAAYLADTIPGAKLVTLPGVSHFAPLQRPQQFNAAIAEFLDTLPA